MSNNNQQAGVSFSFVFSNGGTTFTSSDPNSLPPLLQQMFSMMQPDPSLFMGGDPFGDAFPGFPMFGPRARRDFGGGSWEEFLSRTFAQHQREASGPPPASKKAMDRLPEIMLTQEHFNDSKQTECPVCQDTLQVGDKVLLLPCKHFYHPECARPWLKQHNTCPVCRYELETDDEDYEKERKRRMDARGHDIDEDEVNKRPRVEELDDVSDEEAQLELAIRMSLEESEKTKEEQERRRLREEQDREYLESLARDREREEREEEERRERTGWECGRCTYISWPDASKCEICDASRAEFEVKKTAPTTTETTSAEMIEEKDNGPVPMEVDALEDEVKEVKESDQQNQAEQTGELTVEELRARRIAALERKTQTTQAQDSSQNVLDLTQEEGTPAEPGEQQQPRGWWASIKDNLWCEKKSES